MHQQPVAQIVQNVEQFLKLYEKRVSPENVNKLREGKEGLRTRYDVVLTESYRRVNHLIPAGNEISKLEIEIKDLSDWADKADRTLMKLTQNVGKDYPTLQSQLKEQRAFGEDLNDHKGELMFINKTGTAFLDQAKVGLKAIILNDIPVSEFLRISLFSIIAVTNFE